MGTAAVQEAPPKREPQLKTLTAIENVVNEYARSVVKKNRYRLNDGDWVILLTRKTKGLVMMQRGHPVKIILQWPEAQSHLNTILNDAFSLIVKRQMVDCWAVEPLALVKSRNMEMKKWRREKFGELGEIIGELIPKRYISVVEVVTTKTVRTIRDGISGAEIVQEFTT